MRRSPFRYFVAFAVSALPLALACSQGLEPGEEQGSGGGDPGVGGVASGGGPSGGAPNGGPSGGAASGGASAGGSSAGGLTTGGSSAGGSAAGGASTSDGGAPTTTGGTGSGGSDTGTGGSGDGGDKPPVKPSAGCSKGQQTFTVSNAKVGYPQGYDGSKPYPVVFAFHAAGNNNTQLENHFGNTAVGQKNVMIYLQASGSGWNFQQDRSRYETAYQQVLENGCVDENRVAALGHSSGAQMIVQLLCAGVKDFDAVVPIASSVYCNKWDPVPALVIHGLNDQERCAYGLDDCDGRKDIVPYRTSNSCTETKVDTDLKVGTKCGGNIDPGCKEFEGCGEPTYFCNHNDPQYSNTNHGIPCFAVDVIDDFLSRL